MAAAMATRRAREPMLIALPPRLTTSMSQDSLDLLPKTPGPHTPLPHTPMPYEFALGHELTLQHDKNGDSLTRLEFDTGYSMPVGAVGEKRSRESSQTSDDYECVKDVAWSEEEVEMLQNALLHPWRPVSTSYPPGDLPPTNVIDELANQVLSFAYRSSPRNASSDDDKCWTRTWDETRKKLFSLALDNSKFGQDSKERKMTRQDRKAAQSRPGLRRMDSMDFMDQEDEVTSGETTDETDSISRAIRLSTTLQNTAKLDSGSVGMSRSASEGSGSSRDRPKTRNVSTPQPSSTAPSISVIPASPEPPAPLRRKGSYRGPGAKPIRPSSLLQRGRSFTASDLAAEAEAEIKEIKATPLIAANPIVTSPVSERSSFILKPLTRLSDEPKPVESASEKTVLDRMKEPRLTRSQSSSALNDPPHPVRDTFMSHKPSTTDRSVLAMPLNIVDTANQPARNTTGWSDSEDDSAPVRAPAGKRLRGRGGSRTAKSRPRVLGAEALSFGGALGDGGLRSPFEEKVGMGFL